MTAERGLRETLSAGSNVKTMIHPAQLVIVMVTMLSGITTGSLGTATFLQTARQRIQHHQDMLDTASTKVLGLLLLFLLMEPPNAGH